MRVKLGSAGVQTAGMALHPAARPVRTACGSVSTAPGTPVGGALRAVLATIALGWTTLVAVGQTTQPGTSAGTGGGASGAADGGTSSATSGVTVPYADPTFGFEMKLPVGWTFDRARFQGPEGAIGLLRGERRDVGEALQVLIYRELEMQPFPTWLQGFTKRLGEMYGTKKIQVETWEKAERPRAVLVFDAKIGGYLTRTHYACVAFDPSTVWVLALAARVKDETNDPALRAQFDEIAGSLHVLYDPLAAEQIAAAFERGLAILKQLKADAARIEVDPAERYYDVVMEGKSTGYLKRTIRREKEALSDPRISAKAKEGLHVREESWRFAEDGTVRCTASNLFASFDLRSELIENRTTQIPAPDVQSQRLYIELDQCVREDDTLFSSFTTNLDTSLPDPRPPIPVGPRYLGAAWVRLLPKLLMKAEPERYAFAIYDSQARALTVDVIQPLGEVEVPGLAGRKGFAFEARQGFAAQPVRIYADADGNVLRVEAGELVLTETSRESVEARYAARREPAQRRMQVTSAPAAKP